MVRDPWVRALAMLGCAIAVIYLATLLWGWLQEFSDILLLFFCAWLLAFLLDPVVAGLQRRASFPRVFAVATTYLVLLVVLSLAFVVLIPNLATQIVTASSNLPTFADRITGWISTIQTTANAWLIDRSSPIVFDVRSALTPDEVTQRVESLGPPLLSNALALATGAAALLGELLIVLILSFYFALDGMRLADSIVAALPLRVQDDARFLVANVHRVIAGYVRGQVIQALLGGMGTWFVMSALNVDYALLASVSAGLFLLIPFIGPVAAVVIPVAFALVTRTSAAIFLLIALMILQQVIFNVLGPRILSHHVGLHPLLVFFAVLAGARAAGLWGAILGVPLIALVLTMFTFYRGSKEERVARLQQELPGWTAPPPHPETGPPASTLRTPVAH